MNACVLPEPERIDNGEAALGANQLPPLRWARAPRRLAHWAATVRLDCTSPSPLGARQSSEGGRKERAIHTLAVRPAPTVEFPPAQPARARRPRAPFGPLVGGRSPRQLQTALKTMRLGTTTTNQQTNQPANQPNKRASKQTTK